MFGVQTPSLVSDPKSLIPSSASPTELIIGALIFRIGFGWLLYYNYNKEPRNPIVILKAPTLLRFLDDLDAGSLIE